MIGFTSGQGASAYDVSNNVFIGAYTGYSGLITGASYNTFIGYSAGRIVTSGASNIYLGYYAGSKQTTNSNLLIIDNQTRADAPTELTNSILYGVMVATPASQSLRINADALISGNVGIGTTGPDAKLDSLATTEQLRLTYTDGSVYSSHTVDSSGNLTIDNTGTKTVIADDLQVTGGDILDSNGNESIRFGTTASSVNEATLTNAATGGIVTLAATGGDTDVAFSIDSKGS